MLPRALLACRLEAGRVVPSWLGARDEPWLRVLIDEHARHVGRPRRDFVQRLKEPLEVRAPLAKLRVAAWVLERLSMRDRPGPLDPRKVRHIVFRAAVGAPDRAAALEVAAAKLAVAPDTLERLLFADLADERQLGPLPFVVQPSELAIEANLAVCGGLLRRATRVVLRLFGNAGSVVRHAQRKGLICLSKPLSARTQPLLGVEISGPFELFRHTQLYGRALAELLPSVAACQRFELRADCVLGRSGEVFELRLGSGDPIRLMRKPEPVRNALADRFADDFVRIAADWELVHEPVPVPVAGTLVFPDFEAIHKADRSKRCFIEIIGFWTTRHLENRISALQSSTSARVVLCIDERLNCGKGDLTPGVAVVPFRGRVDAAAVLEALRREFAGGDSDEL